MKIFGKEITFKTITKWLFAFFSTNSIWHFGDAFGTEFTWAMPVGLLVKLFFSYWGVKAILILAGICSLYWLVVAIGRWLQRSLDKSVEKALRKMKDDNDNFSA